MLSSSSPELDNCVGRCPPEELVGHLGCLLGARPMGRTLCQYIPGFQAPRGK